MNILRGNKIISQLTVEFYREKDKEKYNEFLFKNSESCIFHTLEWKNVLEKTFNYKPFYIIIKDSNEDICAALPLFFIKNLAGRRLESLPQSLYCGVLGDRKYIELLIQKTFELKEDLNCDYILFRQTPQTSNVYDNLLTELGMTKYENRLNQYLMIKNPESLWKEIKSSNRRAIRKAKNNKVTVKHLTDEQEIEELYNLELITRKRFGMPTPSIEFYKNIWNELYPKRYLDIFFAEKNEKPIASVVFFNFKNRMLYVYGDDTIEGRKLRANNLLLWKTIEWSYKQECTIFDLGGTPGSDPKRIPKDFRGLHFFKLSFNASSNPYMWYYFPKETSNIDSLINPNFLNKIGGKCFNNLPIGISKKIGMFIIKKFL